jgi:AcrR family transcriptional regulator
MATKRRRRAATLDHNAELWAHIEPETSRLLLLSALDAFLARGFHAATTREIAERAGMSPAAVYVHWRAKHDLLFELSRIGHQAVLDVVEQALEEASEDPVERVHAFVSAFATWHAENHVLARVIQYEFAKLPRPQFRQIVEIRDRFEELMREELAGGVAAGAFDVEDLEGTTLAVLSLCIDLARWYHPGEGHSSPQAVGDLYAELVIRMLRNRS